MSSARLEYCQSSASHSHHIVEKPCEEICLRSKDNIEKKKKKKAIEIKHHTAK